MAPFVLVHGGWHGGWCWKRVTPYLRDVGHEVYTPTLTGLGERVRLANHNVDFETHVLDVVNVLTYEDLHSVVLVGHSMGGTVIEAVAHRVPERIQHLIFLDAILPEDGKSVWNVFEDHGYAAGVRLVREQVEREGEGWKIDPEPPNSPTLGVRDPADIRWMAERLAPIPVETVRRPVRLGNPDAADLPRTFIRCTESRPEGLIPLLAERVRTDPSWHYREIAACHDAMVTEPERVAALLLENAC